MQIYSETVRVVIILIFSNDYKMCTVRPCTQCDMLYCFCVPFVHVELLLLLTMEAITYLR